MKYQRFKLGPFWLPVQVKKIYLATTISTKVTQLVTNRFEKKKVKEKHEKFIALWSNYQTNKCKQTNFFFMVTILQLKVAERQLFEKLNLVP